MQSFRYFKCSRGVGKFFPWKDSMRLRGKTWIHLENLNPDLVLCTGYKKAHLVTLGGKNEAVWKGGRKKPDLRLHHTLERQDLDLGCLSLPSSKMRKSARLTQTCLSGRKLDLLFVLKQRKAEGHSKLFSLDTVFKDYLHMCY